MVSKRFNRSFNRLPKNTPFSDLRVEEVKRELIAGNTLLGIFQKYFVPDPQSGGLSWFYGQVKKLINLEPALKISKNYEIWSNSENKILSKGALECLSIESLQRQLPGRSLSSVKNKHLLLFSRRKGIETKAFPWALLEQKGLAVVTYDQWPGLKTKGDNRLLVLITRELIQNPKLFKEQINNLFLIFDENVISTVSFYIIKKETIEKEIVHHPAIKNKQPFHSSLETKSLIWSWILSNASCVRSKQGNFQFCAKQSIFLSPSAPSKELLDLPSIKELTEVREERFSYFLKLIAGLNPNSLTPSALSIQRGFKHKLPQNNLCYNWRLILKLTNWDILEEIFGENYPSFSAKSSLGQANVSLVKEIPSLEVLKKYFLNPGPVLAHLLQLDGALIISFKRKGSTSFPVEVSKETSANLLNLQVSIKTLLEAERLAEAIFLTSGIKFLPIKCQTRAITYWVLSLDKLSTNKFIDLVSFSSNTSKSTLL